MNTLRLTDKSGPAATGVTGEGDAGAKGVAHARAGGAEVDHLVAAFTFTNMLTS